MHHARLTIDPTRVRSTLDRRLFGGFVEHLGRHIHTGIFEPGHPTADDRGFRRDVVDLVRELGVTTIRYPGGNFVSGFRWEDSVGPQDERPRRLDLAWHSTETNEVGLHEFADWLELVGSDMMLAVNLGTRGTLEALDLMEYTRVPGGTATSDRRIANGRTAPFDVGMWCLGNEMDGPWQLGHRNAEDYGKIAAMTARAMRQVEPEAELVVCGSSGAQMPTFGEWERTVLRHTYDLVDFISCHAYYEERAGDLATFLASPVDMDRFIETVSGIADEVGREIGSEKTMLISFDEWNVWYQERFRDVNTITGAGNWPVAPRLLEDVYSVADAVVVGGLLISLLRHSDRVRSASLAQLVNVIAPIMTTPGGDSWRQTTFLPFATTSRLAHGTVLDLEVDSDQVTTAGYGDIPAVDAACTADGDRASVFVVNRSATEGARFELVLSAFGGRVVGASVLSDADVYAVNTEADPLRVTLQELAPVETADGVAVFELPAASWAAIEIERSPA
ncbi:arabinosylfuranosidase ArfA [Naasia lichenicola]|uniref:non-reducing end alpha-L-arabinofuranosidase n=1 Tax=Naasia lichenicola TaxID=2565933 RepID=A0A4S4FMG6_9MICO|nr:alpha-L-arabinofuranosidase C-terminal domain-containing protein [Naasia lichenicola]THG31599.1 alpha-L-arabinofuranosidase [Naasia lichenicola]